MNSSYIQLFAKTLIFAIICLPAMAARPNRYAITATAGTPQSTDVNTTFAAPLQATIRDRSNNPIGGATVTFTAPANGQSANFGRSLTATAVTDNNGLATAPALTANAQAGTYAVTATVQGGTNTATFNLTNNAAVTTSYTITATAGTPQNTNVSTSFATQLAATVRDQSNNPATGVMVTFTAPANGQSAGFGGSQTATALTDGNGLATAPALTANAQAGSYTITATVQGGTTTAIFSLTNNTTVSSHAVILSWLSSTTPSVTYKIYRATISGGPYTQVASASGITSEDDSVVAGNTYYYVATALDSGNSESGYSNEAKAVVPTP